MTDDLHQEVGRIYEDNAERVLRMAIGGVDKHVIQPQDNVNCSFSLHILRWSGELQNNRRHRSRGLQWINRFLPLIEVKKFVSSGFSLNFQAFFILHFLMEVFPFVFYHPLKPVDSCFEVSYEGFLSDSVENVGDRPF
jgi:hypothetical protein